MSASFPPVAPKRSADGGTRPIADIPLSQEQTVQQAPGNGRLTLKLSRVNRSCHSTHAISNADDHRVHFRCCGMALGRLCDFHVRIGSRHQRSGPGRRPRSDGTLSPDRRSCLRIDPAGSGTRYRNGTGARLSGCVRRRLHSDGHSIRMSGCSPLSCRALLWSLRRTSTTPYPYQHGR